MYQWHLRQVPKTTGQPPPIFRLTHRMSQMCSRWIHTEMWEVKHSKSGRFPPLPALPVSYKYNPQNQHSWLLPSVGSLAYKSILEISSTIKCNCSFNSCNMCVNEDVNVTSSCGLFFLKEIPVLHFNHLSASHKDKDPASQFSTSLHWLDYFAVPIMWYLHHSKLLITCIYSIPWKYFLR